jgi:mannose-1-phosphate guanylyltransferase
MVTKMKAFILCGGQGTRLRPYTYSIPKPMLPLGRKPILEYIIRNLKKNGVTEVCLTVGYLKERIKDYFGDGSKLGVKITYNEEKDPLGTAGCILPVAHIIKGTFIVHAGDHFSRLNVKKMLEFHKKQGGIATVAFKRAGVPLEYGIAHVDETHHVTSFKEKPIVENLINASVYIFEPEILNYIKPKEDFAKNVFPRLMADKKKINAFVFDDYWLDIGRTSDYEKINELVSVVELVMDSD